MTERLPYRTARETECRPGFSSDPVMRAVVVLETGGVFCPRAILNILDEPARLVPKTPAAHRRRTPR